MYSRVSRIKGGLLIHVIAFTAIGIFALFGIMSFGVTSMKMARQAEKKEQVRQIAEAGIEYYRWHLAHDATDYFDGYGATSTGPYVHEYLDKNGMKVGEYALTITPPLPWTTIVTIRSEGKRIDDPAYTRTIVARFAKPSYARYALVSNAPVYYGTGDEVFGEIYGNDVIRFSSPSRTHNLVTSMVNWKNDPSYGKIWGVSCSGDPTPPSMYTNNTCPNILMAGRRINAPQISFTELALDLSSLRNKAIANGHYRGDSGAKGYLYRLKTDDTYDVYRVNSVRSKPGGCTNSKNETGWDLWSVNNITFVENLPFPDDGVLFVADDVWVEGTIHTTRLTLAVGRNANGVSGKPDANIIINNDLLYTTKDGSDVLGIIAENNILIGLYSEDDLEIDGALIAQKGATRRYYYSSSCSATYYRRATLQTFGMYVTNQQPYFVHTSGGFVTSGYDSQPAQYDGSLLYSPPPSFPLTTDQYQILSWDEE
jgi:hypothetical protein